jgi:hypothetical protein
MNSEKMNTYIIQELQIFDPWEIKPVSPIVPFLKYLLFGKFFEQMKLKKK